MTDWEDAYSDWLASNRGFAAEVEEERRNPTEVSFNQLRDWPDYPLWQQWVIDDDLTWEAAAILGILLRSGKYFAENWAALSFLHRLADMELRRKGVITKFIEWRRNGGGE